jgi:hypothetical protein
MVHSLNYNIRTQFYFKADDKTLSNILNQLTLYRINLNGYVSEVLNKNGDLKTVRVVTGTTEGENEFDIQTMRNILKHYRVRYQEKHVIQVLEILSGPPGQINTLYGALWCKMPVHAVYIGEDTKIYLDVTDMGKALEILTQPNLEMCN